MVIKQLIYKIIGIFLMQLRVIVKIWGKCNDKRTEKHS